MKILRTFCALVTLLTAVTAFATHAPPASRSTNVEGAVTLKANCDEVLGLASTPTPMMAELLDRTSKPMLSNLQKLAKPACRSLYGAREVARKAGEDYHWMSNLPFVLEDSLDGLTDQAQFRRGLLLAEFSRSVYVGAGMFTAYSDDEMVWVVGHELAHGVYEHSLTKKCIGLGGAALAFIGFLAAFGAKRPGVKKSSAVACILVGSATVLCIAHLNPIHELTSDVFGVRVLAQAGMDRPAATTVATEILKRHPKDDESPLSKAGIIPSSHPPAKVRIDNIQNLP
jgi:Zn-dependent protease with chaperone function